MSERKRIYLSSPTMHEEERRFVLEAFDTNWIAPLGPNVDGFEKEMCEYLREEGLHACALSSGTAAVHLSMLLLGIHEGDYVFCQSMTFAASVNPVVYEHATPVFIDSEPDTWNMSPDALRAAFEKHPHPKAVIPVHLYGTPARMDEIIRICAEHDVPVVEDAAEALGAGYKGHSCATFGELGCLSFNGNKIITTSGGGMLVSRDADMIERARFLSTQARDPAPHYQHSVIGYNYRMSNVVAGIGRGQLMHMKEHLDRKKQIYVEYKKAFADIDGISMNPMNPDGKANNWLSCITLDSSVKVSRDDIMTALNREINAESRPIWKPMHLQPVYEGREFFADPQGTENPSGSVSEDIFNRGLCLPSDIKNTEEDMHSIIAVIRELFE